MDSLIYVIQETLKSSQAIAHKLYFRQLETCDVIHFKFIPCLESWHCSTGMINDCFKGVVGVEGRVGGGGGGTVFAIATLCITENYFLQ